MPQLCVCVCVSVAFDAVVPCSDLLQGVEMWPNPLTGHSHNSIINTGTSWSCQSAKKQPLVCLIKTELTRGRQDVTAQQGSLWLSIHTATVHYSTGAHTELRSLLIVINHCSPPQSLSRSLPIKFNILTIVSCCCWSCIGCANPFKWTINVFAPNTWENCELGDRWEENSTNSEFAWEVNNNVLQEKREKEET